MDTTNDPVAFCHGVSDHLQKKNAKSRKNEAMKTHSFFVLVLILSFALVSYPQIGTVKAESTVYIRA